MILYDVCGVGNGIVDLIVKVSYQHLAEFGLEKGSMTLVDSQTQRALLNGVKGYECSVVSGGSVANSLVAFSQLGARAALHCCLGDDEYGIFFRSDFDNLGIELGIALLRGEVTGTCLSLVAPDAERTMRTNLGVSAKLSARHINVDIIKRSRWLILEGFLFSGGADPLSAVEAAIGAARAHGCKIAITFSDLFVINNFRAQLEKWVPYADMVVANEIEACAYTGQDNSAKALHALRAAHENVVVTASERGAYGFVNGVEFACDAFECKPLDLTGAGDMFLGAFLYGMISGLDINITARASCYMAMKVISQMGARLHTGVREYWQECVAGRV